MTGLAPSLGGRAGFLLRAAAFFIVFKWALAPEVVRPAVRWVARTFHVHDDKVRHIIPPALVIAQDVVLAAGPLGIAALLVVTERRGDGPLWRAVLRRSYLWDPARWGRHLAGGALTGLGLLSAIVGLLAVLGMAIIHVPPPSPSLLAQQALLLIAFGLVGLAEELFFRGYLLRCLADGLGFAAGAILTTAWFALSHYLEGDTLADTLQCVVYALFCCATIRATGSLTFSIGFHAAWDYGQSGLFGVPDSSFTFPGALSQTVLHGPAVLTGGAAGPEGSIVTLVADAALLVLFLKRGRSERFEVAP